MQYDRDEKGVLTPLPKPCVDTGMGLERIAAVLQGVSSNYEIDLFRDLIRAAARETKQKSLKNPSLNVIADHIRACAFLIVDGVIPGNEGRGYVLRRIIRRAVRHGYKLGQKEPFFHRLVPDLDGAMGEAYPELRRDTARVAEVLEQEELRFAETLENGMALLEGALASGEKLLDGETVFRLYDTYGFPVDLTADICRERGVAIDLAGFEAAMHAQRERARAASRFAAAAELAYSGARTEFCGYDTLALTARVVALYREGTQVEELGAGDSGTVVLDRTPFYAESGGQVGDRGEIVGATGTFVVADTQRIRPEVFGHHGRLATGTLRVGDEVSARVDMALRSRTMRNHSATHLLHAALRQVLGPHVQQKGSRVDEHRTRFDFSHNKPLTREEIRRVEALVNAEIRANDEVAARIMKFDEAIRAGALAFFGDKYGDEVRVVAMGDFSTELCGGTHVRRTGDIGFFKIVSESGVAAGVRRIEAVTGEGALAWAQAVEEEKAFVEAFFQASGEALREKLHAEREEKRALEKEIQRLRSRLATGGAGDLAAQAVDVKGTKVLAAAVDGADARALREAIDRMKERLKSAAIVLGSVADGKVTLVAGVTKDLTAKVRAGELVNYVAQQVGGRGGGRPDLAQAGGNDPAKLEAALASVRAWVEERV
jgi:alanyl-tRNA synthetase